VRVTKKAWFGPKRVVGWGWTVTSREGWLAIAFFSVLVIVASVAFHGTARTLSLVGVLAVFLLTVWLTGDPPGGPGFRDRG